MKYRYFLVFDVVGNVHKPGFFNEVAELSEKITTEADIKNIEKKWSGNRQDLEVTLVNFQFLAEVE